MKVGPQALAATMPPRDHGKPTKAEKADKPETGGLPPGLVRVQAKLEDIAAAERTQGQSNALDRVSRNLARYAQNQGIAAPTTPPAPTTAPTEPTATTDASTGTTGTPTTDAATTPVPADPVAAAPTPTPDADPLPVADPLASAEATPPESTPTPDPAVHLTSELTLPSPTTPTVTELIDAITTGDSTAPATT